MEITASFTRVAVCAEQSNNRLREWPVNNDNVDENELSHIKYSVAFELNT